MTRAVAWVCVLLVLVLASAAGARDVERTAPASAWWKAADLALGRGDCTRALAILNEQVAGHHYGAVARLGDIHETGTCAHLDLPPAREFYERLIANGIEGAKARLGQLHLEGHGVPKDVDRARRLLKEAVLWMVAHEFPERRRGAALELMGRHDVPPELDAELDWADRIENGPARQLYETALKLKDGIGLPKHEDAAKDWLHMAAVERNYPAAFYAWGRWELETERDPSARRWALGRIVRAGQLGYSAALKDMGLRFAFGIEVGQDDFSALVWLTRAHDAGEDVAEALAIVADRLGRDERIVAQRWARTREVLPTFRYEVDQGQQLSR